MIIFVGAGARAKDDVFLRVFGRIWRGGLLLLMKMQALAFMEEDGGVLISVFLAGSVPEGGDEDDYFEECATDHEVVELVPLPACFGDNRRGYQGSYGGT